MRSKILPVFHLKESDFQMVNVDFQDQAAALAAGSIDAFAGVEPFCALAESLGYSELLLNYEKYDPMPNMLASTSAFVTEQSTRRRKAVVAAMVEAPSIPEGPGQGEGILQKLYTKAGYKMDRRHARQADRADGRKPEIHSGSRQVLQGRSRRSDQGRQLRGAKEVDWSKVLIADFLRMIKASKSCWRM